MRERKFITLAKRLFEGSLTTADFREEVKRELNRQMSFDFQETGLVKVRKMEVVQLRGGAQWPR